MPQLWAAGGHFSRAGRVRVPHTQAVDLRNPAHRRLIDSVAAPVRLGYPAEESARRF
ncbi:hypothetical protein [Streptomyces platensis]|uniref:hypothetical protein n=1 Tax=Streptomyces platensis TaxID=58346 RepID=UPI00378A48C6